VPGLGQILAGERRRGLKWLATYIAAFAIIFATCVLPRLTPLLVVIVPLNFSIQLACFVDAYRVGHRSSRAMLGGPGRRYLVAVALLLATMFAKPAVRWHAAYTAFRRDVRATPAGMSPTLQPNERFICHKLGEPRRWDVVMFLAPDMGDGTTEYLFSGSVGLPGEQGRDF
jgi:hypothetical protein